MPALPSVRFIALAGMLAFGAVSTDLYLPALPAINSYFDSNHAQGQWTLSFFIYGFAIGQMIFGPWSDKRGRLPVLKIGVLAYIFTSALCIFAPSLSVLLALRLLQGIAAACGPVLAGVIVNDSYAAKDASRIMSYLSALMAVVPAMAPVIGSFLIERLPWQSHFLVLALFGFSILLAISHGLQESYVPQDATKRFGKPLENALECLQNRFFLAYVSVVCTSFAAMFAYISTTAYIVIEIYRVDAGLFGYSFMVVVFGYIAGSVLSAWLGRRYDRLLLMLIAAAFGFLIGGFIWLFAQHATPPLWLMLAAATGCFLAGGICIPNSQIAAIALFPQQAGMASSLTGTLRAVFAGCIGLLSGFLFDGSIRPSFLLMALNMAACFLALYWIWRQRRVTGGGSQTVAPTVPIPPL